MRCCVLDELLQFIVGLHLSFFTEVEIPHIVCEPNQFSHLSYSDKFLNEVVTFIAAMLPVVCPLSDIHHSYSKIMSSICEFTSVQEKYKAASKCVSHLLDVSLFHCTSQGVSLTSDMTQNLLSTSNASVKYSMVTSMLNLFIHSLRNKQIKRSLKTLFEK